MRFKYEQILNESKFKITFNSNTLKGLITISGFTSSTLNLGVPPFHSKDEQSMIF